MNELNSIFSYTDIIEMYKLMKKEKDYWKDKCKIMEYETFGKKWLLKQPSKEVVLKRPLIYKDWQIVTLKKDLGGWGDTFKKGDRVTVFQFEKNRDAIRNDKISLKQQVLEWVTTDIQFVKIEDAEGL